MVSGITMVKSSCVEAFVLGIGVVSKRDPALAASEKTMSAVRVPSPHREDSAQRFTPCPFTMPI
jgi:hypothetical protein